MNKLNLLSFSLGLLAGIAITWAVWCGLLLHERREHAAAIRELLDMRVTKGFQPVPDGRGGGTWLPLSGE